MPIMFTQNTDKISQFNMEYIVHGSNTWLFCKLMGQNIVRFTSYAPKWFS